MENKIRFSVTTQSGVVWEGRVNYVLLPMVDGGYGILPGHAPVVGVLGRGEIKYRVDETDNYIAVDGGIAEMSDNQLIVMATRAEITEKFY